MQGFGSRFLNALSVIVCECGLLLPGYDLISYA